MTIDILVVAHYGSAGASPCHGHLLQTLSDRLGGRGARRTVVSGAILAASIGSRNVARIQGWQWVGYVVEFM